MILKRSAGILAHPTSFPSPYGIGDLGKGAYDFVDFLQNAKQKFWQILPIGPTSFGDSPYQSFSTFAGNHYLISPDLLAEENFLNKDDLQDKPLDFDPRRVDYGAVINFKTELFRKAFGRFQTQADAAQRLAFEKFRADNQTWLDDYSLFVAVKNYYIEERRLDMDTPEFSAYKKANAKTLSENQINDFYYGAVWSSWPQELARRDKTAITRWQNDLHDEILFFQFLQYEFFRQWNNLKNYANESKISIIGDIPIFVAMDSSDVWAHNDLFQLDADGYPIVVAGVPPDYFSETGQLWGNPLYNWQTHKQNGYSWWIDRVRSVLKTVDIVRVDHFRGFEAYWAVPYGELTAVEGEWLKGPGHDFINALKTQLSDQFDDLPIIAEDLGVITEEVEELRDAAELPGMRILQFAFGTDAGNPYLPHNYKNTNTVVYTGTHDNDTTMGWYAAASETERDYFRRYLNVSGENAPWDLIRLAYASSAACAIVPIQDVCRLDTENRMNMPGQAAGNWRFRYTADNLQPEMAKTLAYFCELFNR